MSTLLSQNVQQAALALALLTLLATILGPLRPRKKFKVHMLNTVRIFPLNLEESKRLQLTYDSNPVDNAYVTFARIKNLGSVPVECSDFQTPVKFQFNPECEVLSASIVYRNPEGLDMPVSFHENCTEITQQDRILVAPHLFNGGDEIGLCFILTNYVSCKTDAHIKGINSIEPGPYDLDLAGLFRPGQRRWYKLQTRVHDKDRKR